MRTLANSEDLDEMPNNAIFHQGLHCLLKISKESEIRNQYNQLPHLIQDTARESDNNHNKTSHTRAKRLDQINLQRKKYNFINYNL